MNKSNEIIEIENSLNSIYDKFSEGILKHLNDNTSETIMIQKIIKNINLIKENISQSEEKIGIIAQKVGCPFPKEFHSKNNKNSKLDICQKSCHKIFQDYILSLHDFFSLEELKKIIEGFHFLFSNIYMIPIELDSYECDSFLPSSITEYIPLILEQKKINVSIILSDSTIFKISQTIKSPSFEKCNIIFDLCHLVVPKIKNFTYAFTQSIIKYDKPNKVKCLFSFQLGDEQITLYFW